MDLRLATLDDLPQLKVVYKKIIAHMRKNNIELWDEVYPCEFFADDIINNRLYVLMADDEIASAFSLFYSSAGDAALKWESEHDQALYLGKFAVNVTYLSKGIGTVMLKKAIELAREKKSRYLRLFVRDTNEPAINFYMRNGLHKVEGIYNEIIDDELTLREFGFEIKTA